MGWENIWGCRALTCKVLGALGDVLVRREPNESLGKDSGCWLPLLRGMASPLSVVKVYIRVQPSPRPESKRPEVFMR